MMAKEQVLQQLKGSDSTKPVSLSELARKLKLPDSVVMAVLDDLYDEGMINRASTQFPLAQLYVWQTGIKPKIRFQQYAPPPPPTSDRKAEIVIVATKNQEKPVEQTKSKARLMIELLLAKGSATNKELAAHSGASSIPPFLEVYIKRGLIVSEGERDKRIYRVAPDAKPEDFAAMKSKDTAPAAAAISPVEAAPSAPASVQPSAFELSKLLLAPASEPDPVPVASVPPATRTPTIDDLPSYLPRQQEATEQDAPVKQRFRVAITSDQTILLFGLGLEPIELDREQATILTEFVSDKSEILCA